MFYKTTISAVACAALISISGCATVPHGAAYVPVVDMQGQDDAKFTTDLSDCQGYARQRVQEVKNEQITRMFMGALLGAALSPNGYRNQGTVAGTAIGAAANMGDQTLENIVRRCLAGRGYNVLN